MSSRPVNFWDGDTSRIPSAPLVVAPGNAAKTVSWGVVDEMEAKKQLAIWTPSLSYFLFLYSFFSFFYLCLSLSRSLFSATKKNSMSLHGPSSSCNKFVTFNGPPRKDRTNLEQQQRWKVRGKIACRGKMFPHFFGRGVWPPSGKISIKNPRWHGEILQRSIWNLNIQSPQLGFCGEKKSVFPGLHKCGERHGLPGISQNQLLHLQLRFTALCHPLRFHLAYPSYLIPIQPIRLFFFPPVFVVMFLFFSNFFNKSSLSN